MRMKAYSLLLISFLGGSALPAAAEGLVTAPSKFSVKETLDKVAAALEARGIKVAARIDHAAAAKAAGLELPPEEVLLFGNPKLGTPLMQANPQIGIDLPLKVLSWQDKDGKVWLGYTAPQTLKARYGVEGKDEVLAAMSGVLQSLAKAGTE